MFLRVTGDHVLEASNINGVCLDAQRFPTRQEALQEAERLIRSGNYRWMPFDGQRCGCGKPSPTRPPLPPIVDRVLLSVEEVEKICELDARQRYALRRAATSLRDWLVRATAEDRPFYWGDEL
jgi:hypothetical protein